MPTNYCDKFKVVEIFIYLDLQHWLFYHWLNQ